MFPLLLLTCALWILSQPVTVKHKSAGEVSCQPKSLPLMPPHVQHFSLGRMFSCKLLCTARYYGNCVVCLVCVDGLSDEMCMIKLTIQVQTRSSKILWKRRLIIIGWDDVLLKLSSSREDGFYKFISVCPPIFPPVAFWRACKSSQHHKTFQINSSVTCQSAFPLPSTPARDCRALLWNGLIAQGIKGFPRLHLRVCSELWI